MYHPAVGGGCVDDGAASCGDSHVAAYYHDVSCLDAVKAGYPLIPARVPPAGGGQIGLPYAHLVQASVYEAGAVKGVGSLGTPDIGAAQF